VHDIERLVARALGTAARAHLVALRMSIARSAPR